MRQLQADEEVQGRPMRYYTNSEMGTFKECRRKWWLGTYRRLRLRATNYVGAAPIGTRIHLAMEPYYQPPAVDENGDPVIHPSPSDTMRKIIAAERAQIIMDNQHLAGDEDDGEFNQLTALLKQFDKEAELSQIMIDGYVQWLEETGADSDYLVIAGEQTVEYEFAPGQALAGRLDVRMQRIHDGVFFGLDHKTCGGFADLERRLPTDEQMLLYEILQRVTNPDFRNSGMIFNMLRKVKRSSTAKPPFFQRTEVRFNAHQLSSMWYRVMGVIRDIDEVTARLDAGESHLTVVYPRPNNDCHWKCEFYPVCPMFDDGSRAEDMIQSLYVQGDPLERYPDLNQGFDA
jgi:hypothetical protein